MAKALGKLKRVNLQEFWGEEFENFSSWIIQDDILEMVGEVIEVELAPIQDEFSEEIFNNGGIVTKDIKNNSHVIIQGQLERITHGDLGNLVSFASRVDATVVIWIAAQISREHKQSLDWLNKVTRDEISFFGAELELWKIDDSAPAANFNLVSQPNQLSGAMKRDLEDGDIGESNTFDAKETVPKKETAVQKKGDWNKKSVEKVGTSPQEKSPRQSKEDISVRENFVYTKSY